MAACAHCGSENPEAARFCNACGSTLTEAALPRTEERKVVTVLFADLVGFTGRSEQLDPEDVRAMLSPYYARLRAELERHGGTVEKFIGDAVMAIFGAPTTHEDDPERAVRAALAIRDWVAERASGLAGAHRRRHRRGAVSLGARPSEGEGMAAGDVVNTAARLQTAAPVDGILVGERTYRATRGAIEYRPADPVRAKGKAEPIPVWEAVEARSRFGVDVVADRRGARRARAGAGAAAGRPRAGDGREQRATRRRWSACPASARAGSSFELARRRRGAGARSSGARAVRCPTGRASAYWALGEMVKAQAGILESDPAEVVEAKLRDAVGAAIGGADRGRMRRGTSAAPRRARRRAGETGGEHRAPGGASSRRWPSRTRSCSCSRTCTGPTTACSTSSTTSSTGRRACRCSSSVRRGPSCSSGGPGWGGGKRERAHVSLSPLSEPRRRG